MGNALVVLLVSKIGRIVYNSVLNSINKIYWLKND